MRINMNNHYSTNSVNADIENIDDDVSLEIKKIRGLITKRTYYKIKISHESDTVTITVNANQLEQLLHGLEVYVKGGNYKKRSDSKKANYLGIL